MYSIVKNLLFISLILKSLSIPINLSITDEDADDFVDVEGFSGVTTKTVPMEYIQTTSTKTIPLTTLKLTNIITESSITKTITKTTLYLSTKTVPSLETFSSEIQNEKLPNAIVDSVQSSKVLPCSNSNTSLPTVSSEMPLSGSKTISVIIEPTYIPTTVPTIVPASVQTTVPLSVPTTLPAKEPISIPISEPFSNQNEVGNSDDSIINASVVTDDDSEEEEVDDNNVSVGDVDDSSNLSDLEFGNEDLDSSDVQAIDDISNLSDIEFGNEDLDSSDVQVANDNDSNVEEVEVAGVDENDDDISNSSDLELSENENDTSNVQMTVDNDDDVADVADIADIADIADVSGNGISAPETPSIENTPINTPVDSPVNTPESQSEADISVSAPSIEDSNDEDEADVAGAEFEANNVANDSEVEHNDNDNINSSDITSSNTENESSIPETDSLISDDITSFDDGSVLNADVPLFSDIKLDNNKTEEDENENHNLNGDNGFNVLKTDDTPIEAPDLTDGKEFTQSDYDKYLKDVNDNISNGLMDDDLPEDSEF